MHLSSRLNPVADLVLALPPHDAEGAELRRAIRDWAQWLDMEESLCEDLVLVASELFSNAVRATADGSYVHTRVHLSEEGVELTLTNRGPGFALSDLSAPAPTRPGGRGIAIAQALGHVSVRQAGRTTQVHVLLRG